MQGLPDLFRCEGGVYMAYADGGQSVHHGISDGDRGRQRGQFPNPFRAHRGQGGQRFQRIQDQGSNVPVNGCPSGL